MVFVVQPSDRVAEQVSPGIERQWVIAPDRLPDRRMNVSVVRMDPEARLVVASSSAGLTWFQPMTGTLAMTQDDQATNLSVGPDHIVMMSRGRACDVVSKADSVLLVVEVPTADDEGGVPDLRVIDWTTEPVLLSEHDSRRRIYLASTGLWGTEAVKGEMITYPPGAIGAAHHHEGAEHFQFILSGTGTALLADERVPLGPGDLVYNLEHEIHSFENLGSEDMTFVEFFVPGRNRTVWVPGVEACAWNPLETDVRGRPAARRLQAHIHGEGTV
jgi:mannose-6-phosphate isomerase-like protein (cupin superfamily)